MKNLICRSHVLRLGTAALRRPSSGGYIMSLLLLPPLLLLPTAARGGLNVVVTTADLAAIASAVGSEQVEITTLARPVEDPHFVDPKPSFIVKLNRADILVHGGAGLESGWLQPLLNGARNSRIAVGAGGSISGNTGVEMLEVPVSLDRAQGDIHSAGNPHYLIDPVNAGIVATALAEGFGRLDPAAAGVYRTNATRFRAQLEVRLEQWRKQLEPFKGETIVAYHNSWPYFARRFGLKMDVFLEPKPGIPPSAAHLATVISTMKERGTRVVLVDPYVPRRTAEMVARQTGARVVDVTQYPGGVKGTEVGYIEMMDYLVTSISKALAR
jgi:ABC-type Zn uptake system ZnuABC Zn-binding protein ZnuA